MFLLTQELLHLPHGRTGYYKILYFAILGLGDLGLVCLVR